MANASLNSGRFILFHKHEKKVPAHAKPLRDLTAIVSAEQLLVQEKRVQLIRGMQEAFNFERSRFDSLCGTLLTNLVNHCQNLPETLNSYYSQQGGFVDNALNRTDVAMQLFSQYLILPEDREVSEEQKLWQYALFSAALLQGIGKLQSDFCIQLYDHQGHFVKEHNPLLGSFALNGGYYAYTFLKDPIDDFRRRLNLLLARMLMPSSGFAWIASNPEVLNIWLALLNEDYQAAGTFGVLLIRSRALALQRYFQQFLHKNFSRNPRYTGAGTFAGANSSVIDLEQKLVAEFIQWMTKALAEGELIINQAALLLVPGGLLMSAEGFKMFISGHPNYRGWQAVRMALLSLGLLQTNEDGSVLFRFEHTSTQKVHTGALFSDFALVLPPHLYVLNSEGKRVSMSATELIKLAQFQSDYALQKTTKPETALPGLNGAGQWQPMPETQSHNVSYGVKSGV